ncbi:hypothetical protein BD309DRAFT_971842 [Dichomitus squalens]|uniref:Uncharacterized protein n=1 Tax=Dichomitus squalens TaxID=114155 RepID=A0A4Q9NFT6_9APHY|nr:hypothetical protein BD309DRAFT_971842 [Dichomitus squalens]TBU55010.1 hypothetical protein BD310DRAFT_934649 [Dichomitus squalens]
MPSPTIVASFRITLLSSPRSCLRHIRHTPHWPGRRPTVCQARQLTTGNLESGEDSTQPERLKRRWQRRTVCTLDSTKLTPTDYVDFSMLTQPNVQLVARSSDPNDASNTSLGRPLARITARGFRDRRFPPNTAGFLYYHTPPYSPPLAGELRFRITPSPDPASFSQGSDLLTEYGVHWKIPLLYMTGKKNYTGLHRLLLQGGLVTPQLLDVAASAAETLINTDYGQKIGFSMAALVSSFGRGFNLRVGGYNGLCLMIGTNTILKKEISSFASMFVPVDGIRGSARYFPFEGSMICCFEPSTLPEHAGRRVVVLRVLRLLDNDPIRSVPPPTKHEYPLSTLRPREGQLFMTMRWGKVQPWSVDVDRDTRRPATHMGMEKMLRILYENQELY